MTPNYSDIIYFLEVANTLNISRASERLGLSQPSLSASIKRLEDALDTQLLIRSKSGVQLTKSGLYFQGQAKELLSFWHDIKNHVKKSAEEVVGKYKIGCHASVARYTLYQFLPQLLQQNPALEIDLFHDLSRIICERVISYEIDFGIVVNPVPHPDLVIKELARDNVSFWITASSRSALDHQQLIMDPSLLQSQDLLNKLKKKKFSFTRTLQSNNLELIAQLTAEGLGIGIIPERVVQNSGYKLKIYNKDFPVFHDQICLVYRADVPKSSARKKIIESILSFK